MRPKKTLALGSQLSPKPEGSSLIIPYKWSFSLNWSDGYANAEGKAPVLQAY